METYLVHHGILGQKWGVRRYQNSDGSLTEAGRKRYGADEPYNERKQIRGVQNRLNDYSKAIARNQILAKEQVRKAEKAKNKSVEAKSESARKRALQKMNEAVRNAQRYNRFAEKGKKEIERMLRNLPEGLELNGKTAYYNSDNVHTGKMVTKGLLAAGLGAFSVFALGSGATHAASHQIVNFGKAAVDFGARGVDKYVLGEFGLGAVSGVSGAAVANSGKYQRYTKYKVRKKKDA